MIRPFLTARRAAELLGVLETDVIDDVQEGMDGALPALNGGVSNGVWLVYQYELEGERLEMHRKRLTHDSAGEYPGQGSTARKATADASTNAPPVSSKLGLGDREDAVNG